MKPTRPPAQHRCALTEVVVPFDEAYVLDLGAARALQRVLLAELRGIEELIRSLGADDLHEAYDDRGKLRIQRRRRTVCEREALRIADAWPEAVLMIPLRTWIADIKRHRQSRRHR